MGYLKHITIGSFISLGLVSAFAQVPDYKPTAKELAQGKLFNSLTIGNRSDVAKALQAGADPNEVDFIDMTPLDWADNIATVDTLLKHGARINETTVKGTALFNTLAVGSDAIGVHLLKLGADPKVGRTDKLTPLMNAAYSGSLQSMKLMLRHGVDIEAKSKDGQTALSFAVRGNQVQALKLLLAHGARVESRDKLGRTPLHYASLFSRPNLIRLLVSHGANIEARDLAGSTPLILANRYVGDASTVQALITAGAKRSSKDHLSLTAAAWASRRGFVDCARLLNGRADVSVVANSGKVHSALAPALSVIQRSMSVFQQRSNCVSCHHQGLGVTVLASALQHKLPVNGGLLQSYMGQMAEDGKAQGSVIHAAVVNPKYADAVPILHTGDFSFGGSYIFGAMRTMGVPANPGFAEGTLFIARLQNPVGYWDMGPRGVMQHSTAMNTAMVLDVLNSYYPGEKKEELEASKAKAKRWAMAMKPGCAEDLAGRLLILKATDASATEIGDAVSLLHHAQKKDGGWGLADRQVSDAYTTGVAIYALRNGAGESSGSEVLRKATAFLLRTQDPDGSWFEAKSTAAFNNYFDTTFPHGFDQYSSFAGTCWAALGLMSTLDKPVVARR